MRGKKYSSSSSRGSMVAAAAAAAAAAFAGNTSPKCDNATPQKNGVFFTAGCETVRKKAGEDRINSKKWLLED